MKVTDPLVLTGVISLEKELPTGVHVILLNGRPYANYCIAGSYAGDSTSTQLVANVSGTSFSPGIHTRILDSVVKSVGAWSETLTKFRADVVYIMPSFVPKEVLVHLYEVVPTDSPGTRLLSQLLVAGTVVGTDLQCKMTSEFAQAFIEDSLT